MVVAPTQILFLKVSSREVTCACLMMIVTEAP
jgi:hypothetical protein